jgi:DNA primase
VERLAIEAGLPVPKMTREAEEHERKRHTLEDAVALAAQWFKDQLQTQAGKEARDYLQDRGLSAETIERFALGYAPNQREALKNALMKQNLPEAMLVEAGLLATPDEGATYDRFRGRLMFPIKSAQGKIVAFGGRILPSAQTPNTAKYLNSPETPLFKKGELLFAYDIAGRAARDSGNILVGEGYMDVIALHQAGFNNAVAPLGTAITESQLRLLWRVASEPTLCLDGDSAGQRAMLRAADLALPLLKPGVGLKFALLPAGEDPDSFIRKSGVGAMQQVLAQARVLSHVLWEQALNHFGSETAEKKASLEQHLMQSAERIADNIVKQHMREYFRNQLYGLSRQNSYQKKGAKPVASSGPLGPLPEANDDVSHIKSLEDQIVSLVILHPNILHRAEIEEHFGHMDFTQPMLDKLRTATLEVSAGTQSMDSASLCASLTARGHGEKVETLLHSKTAALSRILRAEIMENSRTATHAFEQAYSAYTMKKLEHELHDAAHILERDMSQKSYDRFLALQKQIDELRRIRYAVTPDEQIS